MDKSKIAHCVEQLCQQGCSEVRSTITRLESNQRVTQVEGLSEEDRRMILEELREIMAVYDRP